jgi:2-oxoglutarate dehydrogenase E2 component (dihydrolipoamide succinyltransferase)
MAIEIRVPTLGESVTEATIGRWFKKAGEPVAADEPLVELETDKVTVEVPSPVSGTLASIAAKDGDTVAVGALLGAINEGAAAPSLRQSENRQPPTRLDLRRAPAAAKKAAEP